MKKRICYCPHHASGDEDCDVCIGCKASDLATAGTRAEIDRLKNEIECWEAMKSGVEVRLADQEKRIDDLKKLLKNLAQHQPLDECCNCECCGVRVVTCGSGKPAVGIEAHDLDCAWRLAMEAMNA